MTDTPTPPPAGWYPAPDGSSATWWWDGAAWSQPHDQAGQLPATTDAIAKLATATQVLLIVCGAMSVATIGIETFGISAATGFLSGSATDVGVLDLYDQSSLVVSILSSLVLLATGIVWVNWQYRVAKQVADRTRRSAGWHVGSWFVPIISLWFPYQNVADLWRAVGRTRPSWQIVWWLLWVGGNLMVSQSTRVSTAAEDLEQFRVAMSISLAAEILLLAAVPFAWLVVRGITQGVMQRPAVSVHSLVA